MTGRYDASIGLYVRGDGKGNFRAMTAAESGIRIQGDARILADISINGKPAFIAGVNQGKLQVYRVNN
jgi:hypothetical protein